MDFNTMASSDIKDLYMEKSHKSNISIIEGNKGLFDGVSLDGKDSNEHNNSGSNKTEKMRLINF